MTRTLSVCALVVLGTLGARGSDAQDRPLALAVTRAALSDLRAWDVQVDRMVRDRS